MKASELPFDTRNQILSQLRAQFGAANYDRMVDQFGEDGLIDLVVATSSQPAIAKPTQTQPPPPERPNPWAEGLYLILSTILEQSPMTPIALWIGSGVDQVVATTRTLPSSSTRSTTQSQTNSGCSAVLAILFSGIWLITLGGPVAAIEIVLGGYILAVIFYAVSNFVERVGWGKIAKASGLIAVAACGGALLWFGGSWLFESVRLWWGWLGTHV